MNTSPPEFIGLLLLQVICTVVLLTLAGAILYVVYFLLTLPMRRAERARLFIDLLDLGYRNGRTAEETITSAAASRDSATGVRFYLVAEHIRMGKRLSEALRSVPRFLPPRVTGMVAAGERAGNVPAILDACRASLAGAISTTRGAQNYLVLLLFGFTPLALAMPLFISRTILPKFQELFATMMEGAALPAFTRFVFGTSPALVTVQAGLIVLLWLALFIYLGGPQVRAWFGLIAPSLAAQVSLSIPWERLRLRKDFSACLAVLLDAGVHEAEAVTLAAQCTDNALVGERADAAAACLKGGMALPEAVGEVDGTGELRWRLRNAAKGGQRFAPALQGWHESLEARAFQLQQGIAQVATTVILLMNGLIVGAIVIAMFLPLIALNSRMALW